MKKEILLVYIFLNAVSIGFAQKQLDNSYSVNLGNFLEYDIDFYSNGEYELSVSEQAIPNIKEITILSSGRYTVKNNRISLLDSCTGFQIQCERKADKLKVIKGFPFMLQHLLDAHGNTFDPKDIPYNTGSMNTQNERNRYKQAHPDPYPLYYSPYINGSYVLEIKKDHKYTLVFKGLLLAEGVWKRDNNELLLLDESPIYSITHQTPAFDKVDPNDPWHFVEEMPRFPDGGEKAMLSFIEANTHYPEPARKAGIKGRVIITCVIEKDGSISTVKVAKKLTEECDEEAIRVIKSMPKWIPGKQNGIKVSVRYTIPVTFGMKE